MYYFDFYTSKKNKHYQYTPPADVREYPLSFNATSLPREHAHKKVHRTIAIITALLILSFTAGLIVGIKFAGGENKQIIDPHTREILENAAQKAKNLVEPTRKQTFPKNEYPYVIKIGSLYNKNDATKIATLLSKSGHRIIIGKNNDQYTLFAGPYRSLEEAKKSLKIIMDHSKNGTFNSAIIIKR